MTNAGDPSPVTAALQAHVEDRRQPVVVVDDEARLRYANSAAAALLCGDRDTTLTGRLAADLLVPRSGDESELLPALRRAAAAEEPVALRAPDTGSDGDRLLGTVDAAADSWAVSLRPDDDPGDPGAEAPSTASLDAGDYRRALETAADGIAILDPDGRYRYVNPAHASLYGYDSPESQIGKHWRSCYDEAEAERLAAEIAAELGDGTGTWRGEAEGQRRGGEPWPQELALSALPDGGLVCVVRDRTEQRRHERTLETLRETTRDLLSATDRETAAEVAVRAASKALDLPLSAVYLHDEAHDRLTPTAYTETVATTFGDLPTFDASTESLAWTAYTTGEPQQFTDDGATGTMYNPDTAAAAELVLPLGDHGVLILGHLGDEELDEESIRLAQTLAASLTTAMDQMAAASRLRERNDQLERLSSVLSHDLRDPLNTAMATTSLARAAAEGEADERLAELEAIHARMETLIEEVLALARGTDDIDPEPVALAPLAREAWKTARRGTDADGATLAVEVSRTVAADRPHLRRLLENLFGNAVRHGGPDVEVTIGETEAGFYVADDGPGIPPDERDRVFERGFTTGDGTGLGLDIVRAVAEAHGWSVTVQESASGGARFDIEGVDRAPSSE